MCFLLVKCAVFFVAISTKSVDRPALVPRGLDDGQVIAAADAEIAPIEKEGVGGRIAHDLEASFGRPPPATATIAP
jgi:hypothetical protein